MTVLDVSAVLALINDEPGAAAVAEALPGATISTVSLAEVVGTLVDAGLDGRRGAELLEAAGVVVESFTTEDAVLAGAFRAVAGGSSLSLGDRCCLALTARSDPAEVLTADRLSASLDIPVVVRLVR